MNWKSLIEENGHVTIPEGVTSIRISDSVSVIEAAASEDCINVKEVQIKNPELLKHSGVPSKAMIVADD
jgi:hypothetical protein